MQTESVRWRECKYAEKVFRFSGHGRDKGPTGDKDGQKAIEVLVRDLNN
jgi:hypothetical protein